MKKTFIYVPEKLEIAQKSLEQSMQLFKMPAECKIGTKLHEEVSTDQYSLVIDARHCFEQNPDPIEFRLTYEDKQKFEKIVELKNVTTLVSDLVRTIYEHYMKINLDS